MSMKIWETIIQQRKGEWNKTAVAVTKLNDNKIVNLMKTRDMLKK